MRSFQDPDYLEKTRGLKLAPVARDFVLSHFLLFNLNFLSLALYSKLQIDMMLFHCYIFLVLSHIYAGSLALEYRNTGFYLRCDIRILDLISMIFTCAGSKYLLVYSKEIWDLGSCPSIIFMS
jgi:hypothetical protein